MPVNSVLMEIVKIQIVCVVVHLHHPQCCRHLGRLLESFVSIMGLIILIKSQ